MKQKFIGMPCNCLATGDNIDVLCVNLQGEPGVKGDMGEAGAQGPPVNILTFFLAAFVMAKLNSISFL